MKKYLIYMGMLLMVLGLVQANTVDSSTMWFRGTLVDNMDGTFSGILPMVDEAAEALGDGISGYDIYAKNGAVAMYDKAGSGSEDYAHGVVSDHDAYTTAGGWGSFYDPDVADWYNYQLRFDSGKWYVEYNGNVGNDGILTGAAATPMSGPMNWGTMYALESDAGAYYSGMGTPENAGFAATNPWTTGTAGAWDMDWSWGSENIPLEFNRYLVELTPLGGDEYLVSMVPSEIVITPTEPGVIGTGDVDGTAEIMGGNAPPVVQYMWVLPDEDDSSETQVNVDPGMERDDIYACIVVSDPQGRDTIEKVFANVHHPDGSYKYQVHAKRLDPGNENQAAEIKACIADAVEGGLITESQAYDLELDHGIDYNIFDQGNWHMYKVYLPMYYHQPSGWYNVTAWATDVNSGLSQSFTRAFEWVAGTYLVLDFDSIDFGDQLAPGVWTDIDGDLDMGTADRPTLKNNGNTEVQVSVMFSEFRGDLFDKVIDEFDAQLRNLQATNNWNDIPGEHLEFPANQEQEFTWPIQLCRQEKIDFSIHPDTGAVPDVYDGTLTIYATPVIVDTPPYADDGSFLEFDGYHPDNLPR